MKFVSALDLKNGDGSVYKGSPKTGKADCILNIDEETAINVFEGREDAMKVLIDKPFLFEKSNNLVSICVKGIYERKTQNNGQYIGRSEVATALGRRGSPRISLY